MSNGPRRWCATPNPEKPDIPMVEVSSLCRMNRYIGLRPRDRVPGAINGAYFKDIPRGQATLASKMESIKKSHLNALPEGA